MKTMKKLSLMKLVDTVKLYLDWFLMLIGLGLLVYPEETLEKLHPALEDPAMARSLLLLPMLWLVLSLVQILPDLARLARKKFISGWRK